MREFSSCLRMFRLFFIEKSRERDDIRIDVFGAYRSSIPIGLRHSYLKDGVKDGFWLQEKKEAGL